MQNYHKTQQFSLWRFQEELKVGFLNCYLYTLEKILCTVMLLLLIEALFTIVRRPISQMPIRG